MAGGAAAWSTLRVGCRARRRVLGHDAHAERRRVAAGEVGARERAPLAAARLRNGRGVGAKESGGRGAAPRRAAGRLGRSGARVARLRRALLRRDLRREQRREGRRGLGREREHRKGARDLEVHARVDGRLLGARRLERRHAASRRGGRRPLRGAAAGAAQARRDVEQHAFAGDEVLCELGEVPLAVELHDGAAGRLPEVLRRREATGEGGVAASVGRNDRVEDERLRGDLDAAPGERVEEVGGGESRVDRRVDRARAVADVGDVHRRGRVQPSQVAGGGDRRGGERNEERRELRAGGEQPGRDVRAGALDGRRAPARRELALALRRDQLVSPTRGDGHVEARLQTCVRQLHRRRRARGEHGVVTEQCHRVRGCGVGGEGERHCGQTRKIRRA